MNDWNKNEFPRILDFVKNRAIITLLKRASSLIFSSLLLQIVKGKSASWPVKPQFTFQLKQVIHFKNAIRELQGFWRLITHHYWGQEQKNLHANFFGPTVESKNQNGSQKSVLFIV